MFLAAEQNLYVLMKTKDHLLALLQNGKFPQILQESHKIIKQVQIGDR